MDRLLGRNITLARGADVIQAASASFWGYNKDSGPKNSWLSQHIGGVSLGFPCAEPNKNPATQKTHVHKWPFLEIDYRRKWNKTPTSIFTCLSFSSRTDWLNAGPATRERRSRKDVEP